MKKDKDLPNVPEPMAYNAVSAAVVGLNMEQKHKLAAMWIDGIREQGMKTPDTAQHRELCQRGGKWLTKHSQNVLVPNCSIVAVELFTQVEPEIPDIIGWCSWCSVMIEVKVQRSDFLQDFKKPFRQICPDGVGDLRFYLCPENMISENELPGNWGLLYETKRGIKIIKKAERQSTNLVAERNMLTSYIRNKT